MAYEKIHKQLIWAKLPRRKAQRTSTHWCWQQACREMNGHGRRG